MCCERLNCIYYNAGACRLSEISINADGVCSECIDVHIDFETLAAMRDQQYQEMLARDKALFDGEKE